MLITVNGDMMEIQEGLSVSDFIAQGDFGTQRFAIEINEELVPRTTFMKHIILSGDDIEVVQAIGGG